MLVGLLDTAITQPCQRSPASITEDVDMCHIDVEVVTNVHR